MTTSSPLEQRQRLPHTFLTTLHFLLTFFTTTFLRTPFHLVNHYIFNRRNSPLVQITGRHPIAEIVQCLARWSFGNTSLPPSRLLYEFNPIGWKDKRIKRVEVNGIRGVWITKPSDDRDVARDELFDTRRKDDELVLYYIHGGAFTYNLLGSLVPFFKALAVKLNDEKKVRMSVFMLDYDLAPEYVYPHQPFQILQGYRYLVSTLSIDPTKICIAGDSAGGNLVVSLLLHLDKPNPLIDEMEMEKERRGEERLVCPGSTLLFSPYTSLVSHTPSRNPHSPQSIVDIITDSTVTIGAFHYLLGEEHGEWKYRAGPTWDVRKWFGWKRDEEPPTLFDDETDLSLSSSAPTSTMKDVKDTGVVEEGDRGQGVNGIETKHDDKEERRSLNWFKTDPFLNPDPKVVNDLEWYRRAFPGSNKTLIMFGGMELFYDDIRRFVDALKEAGVDPLEIYQPLKTHDWPLFDFTIPFYSRVKSGGPESQHDFGMNEIIRFLVGAAGRT